MSRTTSSNAQAADPAAISLTRLLNHLEESLLSPNADPSLRTSNYNRTKLSSNLEYARSLLLRLEHDAGSIKIQSRKQSIQADLQAKRELIKQLNQRLYELNQLDDDEDISDAASAASSDSEDEDADLFPSYAPAVRSANSGLDRDINSSENPALQEAAANLSSTLRARRAPTTTEQPTGTTTSSSLFPSNTQNPAVDPSVAQTETLMGENRAEQEALTSSLLSMAQALKSQSLAFSSSLESSNPVLDRASEGLDKSSQGMAAAEKRMGMLRRMTEGKGWWGRILLYAWIGGMWVAAFLIVFVGPKLRF